MGCEENFLLRFGDVSCDPDQLQLAGGKTGAPSWDKPDKGTAHPTTFPTHFPTKKWCHFACVYDGSQITMYLDGEPMGDPVKATGDISSSLQPVRAAAPKNSTPQAIYNLFSFIGCKFYRLDDTVLVGTLMIGHP